MFFSYTYQEVEQNRTFYLQMYDSSHQLVQIDQTVDWHQLYDQLKRYYPKKNWSSPHRPHYISQNPYDSGIGGLSFCTFYL